MVSFPKDVNMQRLVYRQAVVFDGVFYQQLEADGGNPAVCPLQLFIHIDAYGILVAHPYQVEVGTLDRFSRKRSANVRFSTISSDRMLKLLNMKCGSIHQTGKRNEYHDE